MTNPLLSVVAAVSARAKHRLERQTQRMTAAQDQFLQALLRRHEDTELGQQFGLRHCHSVDAFRQRVPMWTYDEYEPYLQRVAQGDRNVVTPDPVVYLNLTSGSTGRQKLVPVTQRSKRAVNRANQAGMGFGIAAAQRRGVPIGRMLLTTSAKPLGQTTGGIPYGHISGGSLRLVHPFMYQQICAQPFEALLVDDSLARSYVCLLFALRDPNLAIVAANFPVLGLQLCEYLERYANLLIEDIATGQIGSWLAIAPDLRTVLEQRLRARPQRADDLRRILAAAGCLRPQYVWPNLSFIVTAKGGTSDFYLQRYPDYFGDTPVFGGIYASSEATFGVHRDFHGDDTILALDSGFYEFVPAAEWDNPTPRTLLPHEVEPGAYYRILVTNHAGFYRYDIGDVVEVTGFHNQAPLVVFRHRRGGLLSATTEKTTEHHVIQVMKALQSEYHVQLEDFCVTLSENVVEPYYVLNMELAPGAQLDHPAAFLWSFDQKLQAANTSYALKRPKRDIQGPHLRLLAAGSFAQLRRRSPQGGGANTQMKLPHISSDRAWLDGLSVQQIIPFPEERIATTTPTYR